MNKLTCAIIEDDSFSLKMIEALIEKSDAFNIDKSFTSSVEAAKWLSAHPVDVLFLDIEMPDMSGLELLKSISQRPDVIIISSKPEFAIHAFEFSVVDYLLKPIKDYSRFMTAINKVIAKHQPIIPNDDNTLFIKTDSLLQKINTDEILWIEAFGDYIKIQSESKLFTVYGTLKKIAEKLPDNFIRVHRSYIVNLSKISNIEPNNIEINRKIIPVSLSYKEGLIKRIRIF